MKPRIHPVMEDVTLPGILYALGDPVRLAIVQNLYTKSLPLTCMQAIEKINDLPVSTRSHCFRILREAGLIRSEKRGRECYNSLRVAEINKKFPGLLNAVLKVSAS